MLVAHACIEPNHLDIPPLSHPIESPSPGLDEEIVGTLSLKDVVRRTVIDVERELILQVLTRTHGNKAQAARILQADYKTIHKKVRQYAISSDEIRDSWHHAALDAAQRPGPDKPTTGTESGAP